VREIANSDLTSGDVPSPSAEWERIGDFEGFRIWPPPENTVSPPVIVRFANPLLYVNSNESFRIAPYSPPQQLHFPHAFWEVTDSELVGLFHRASCNAYTVPPVLHFAFQPCDDCVDVLSVSEPEIIFDLA
jgi:hypothetical protein